MRVPKSPLVYNSATLVPALEKVLAIVVLTELFLIDFDEHGTNGLALVSVTYHDNFVDLV